MRARALVDQLALVSLPANEREALHVLAPELELLSAAPEDIARRTLDLEPRAVLLADPDPDRALRTIERLRHAGSDARILLITPPAASEVRLRALELGVDEALAGPVAMAELAGRLRLLLRRSRPARRTRLRIGDDLELDLDRRQLLRGDQWVHLRPKEARLLELFARAPGKVLSRDHILERVWGPGHDGDPRTVDVHVRWLRAKIEPDPHAPVRLLTVRGVGYRLEPAR